MSEPSPDDEVSAALEILFRIALVISVAFFLAGLVLDFFGACWGSWTQRSGAVIVMAGTWLALKVTDKVFAEWVPKSKPDQRPFVFRAVAPVKYAPRALWIILSGTFVWGFGDIGVHLLWHG